LLLRVVSKKVYRRHRRIFEEHHVFGRKLDKFTTLCLCLNCHALVTLGYIDAGIGMQPIQNPTEFSGMIFRAQAVHFRMLTSVITSKPANGDQVKTGQREWPGQDCFTPPVPLAAS